MLERFWPPLVLTLGLSLAVVSLSTCTGGGPAGVVLARVNAGNDDLVEVLATSEDTFEPAVITIRRGTTVRWRNTANILHTITPDGHREWVPAVLSEAGETFEHTFLVPGVFPYYCSVHRELGMRGIITVEW